MTTLFSGFIAVTLMSTASWSALAQAPAPARSASGPPLSASAPQPATGSGYRSAFDGHRRFEAQKVLPWRESNDLVGRLGGWQAYARESAGGASQPTPAPHGGHTPPKTP